MERITVRLKGVGPVGFVRVVTPCTLAQLRVQITEQIGTQLPTNGFRFLVGGVPVSLVQESGEDYQEGDVFIAGLPPGTPEEQGTPASSKSTTASLPARAPAQTLVAQWVDAFGFMANEEQHEAVGLLRLRYPAAASLLGGGGGTSVSRSRIPICAATPLASAAPSLPSSTRLVPGPSPAHVPQSPMASCTIASTGTPPPPPPPPPQSSQTRPSSSYRSGGVRSAQRPSSAPRSRPSPSPQRGPPPPQQSSARGYTPLSSVGAQQMPAWSMSASQSASELRPAPLDERIARLYYGRAPDGRPMASPRQPRSRTPSSRQERTCASLHRAGTITSNLRLMEAANRAEGVVFHEGSANAAVGNEFAFGLRKYELSPPASPTKSQLEPRGDASTAGGHESQGGGGGTAAEEPLSPRRAYVLREQAMDKVSPPRASQHAMASGIEGLSPSSLSRPSTALPISVGSLEAPSTEVAFGSGRPQRPQASIYTASPCVPAVASNGDMMGVF